MTGPALVAGAAAAPAAHAGAAGPGGLPHDAPYEDWVRVGEGIAARRSEIAWETADWLAFGDARYPGESVRAAAERLDISPGKISDYCLIANTWPVFRRRNTLPFWHHLEVVRLPEMERNALLAEAEAESWTRRELRERTAEVRHKAQLARKDARIAELERQLESGVDDDGKEVAATAAIRGLLNASLRSQRAERRKLRKHLDSFLSQGLAHVHGNAQAGLAKLLARKGSALCRETDELMNELAKVALAIDGAAFKHELALIERAEGGGQGCLRVA